NVPFVSDSGHRALVNYENSEGYKALALNVRGYFGYATRRTDEATARRVALETCNNEVKRLAVTPVLPFDACEIYSVGERIVWTYKRPPLPPSPYYFETAPKPARTLDVATVPLVGDGSRKVFSTFYAPGSAEKAIALGRRMNEFSVWGASSRREAVR